MSFDHNILSNPAPETGGKAGAWRESVFSQVTEQRTSERSSFDPRNKEGWEGEGKRRRGGERGETGRARDRWL